VEIEGMCIADFLRSLRRFMVAILIALIAAPDHQQLEGGWKFIY
jgi:hypothetical protein